MFPSFLTILCWAFGVIGANRAARYIGGVATNFVRLSFALVLLAAWAHLFGKGLEGPALALFIVSGCVGFGFGDIGLFESMPILGPGLAVVLSQCLAAPIAAVIEWLWLGTALTPMQIVSGAAILAGVSLAVVPKDHPHLSRALWLRGGLLGLLAAVGQAGGAVLSRKAYQVSQAAGVSIDGGTAAYQRAIGGVGIALAFFLLLQWRAGRNRNSNNKPREWRRAWPWLIMQTVMGPTLGVSCFQWALATTPSGIVLPIVAIVPLAVMPLAYFFEGDRPSARSLIGSALAVAGAVALTVVK